MFPTTKISVFFSAFVNLFLSSNGHKEFIYAFILILFAACLEGLNVSLVFVAVSALLAPDLPSIVSDTIDFFSNFINLNYEVNRGGFDATRLILLLMLPPIYIIKNLILFLIHKNLISLAASVQENVGLRLYQNYLSQSYLILKGRHSSTVIKNIVTEVSLVSTVVESVLLLSSEVLVLLILGGIILWVSPEAGLVSFCFVISYAFIFYFICVKRLQLLGEKRQNVEGMRLKQLKEALSCIKEIKIFAKEHYFFKLFEPAHVEHSKNVASTKLIMRLPTYLIETFIILIGAVVITMTVLAYGGITEALPYLTLFMAAMLRVAPSLGKLNMAFSTIKLYMPVVELLNEELKETSKCVGNAMSGENNLRASSEKTGVNTCFHSLELKDIIFSYPSSEVEVLNGVNLNIESGDFIGIIGGSGSGKSTMLDILIGLLDPSSGTKKLNSKVINKGYLFNKNYFGYVPQKTFLLDDTIARNIAFGIEDHCINLDRVHSVLRQVNLSDHVQSLDRGIHEVVGEDGATLSGGQCQRLNIARMLYLDAQILILDEATSALDVQTEKEILYDLNNLRGTRPVIFVTHRVSALAHCNKIYNLAGGKLIPQDASTILDAQ
jgi:ABC-type multidrug transport system fused ATPase/permease subunit